MTPKQRITLQADWWPAACRSQGWKPNDRALRLRVCAWCVSLDNPTQHELLQAIQSDLEPRRPLQSTNDLDSKGDIDRVKACLLMLADDLKRTQEVGKPKIGSARRKRDVIRSSLKCLALFEAQPKRFLASLVNDMFNHGRPGLTIRDLTDDPNIRDGGHEGPSELERLVMRLAQVVNDKRNRNELVPAWQHLHLPDRPLTIHEMKVAAGVFCDCAACSRKRAGEPSVPVPVAEEDWTDFEPELEHAVDEFGGDSGTEEGDPF